MELELGYPKRTKRERRQGNISGIKLHTLVNQIFLWKLCKVAPHKSFFLWFSFGINLLNLAIVAVCSLSYVCMIITNGANPSDLYKIIEGQQIGTRFVAKKI